MKTHTMKISLKMGLLAALLTSVLGIPGLSAQQFLVDTTLTPNTTHLLAFSNVSGSPPCFLAYNSNNGVFQMGTINHTGGDFGSPISSDGFTTLLNGQGISGFTHLTPFSIGETSFHVLYNTVSGDLYFNQVNADCSGEFSVYHGNLGGGLTNIMPFYVNGNPNLMTYNKSNSQVEFLTINANANGYTLAGSAVLGAGVTHLMPYSVNGAPYFIAYNAANGSVRLMAINSTLNGLIQVGATGTWLTTWTHFVPSPTSQEFIVYSATTGAAMAYNAAGNGLQFLKSISWAKGVSLFAPFYFTVSVDMGERAAVPGFAPYFPSGETQVWLY